MAYDEHLEERIRVLLPDKPGVISKKMFGGLAFMLDGNMAVGVDAFEEILTAEGVRRFDLSGKRMNGWVLVGGLGIAEDEDLECWVNTGMAFAASLPPK